MKIRAKKQRTQTAQPGNFGMFRLSKSKEIVDACPNTIRAYFKQGLPCYRRGKSVWVSMAELEDFLMRGGAN
jgi:hypothetical protein